MGTISDKLTYLNDTKQLLKENINNLGGNLTNEPFRQYASVLDGIYERLPKVSGIGASLSLSPSLRGKIKLNEIQGDTLQDGTPTPSSPVPIQSVTGLQNVEVCGKNLINGLLDNSTTGKKLERTINANENFYLYIKTNNTTSDRCYAFLDNTNVGTIWVSNNNGTLTFSGSRNFAFNRIRIQDNTTVSENMLTLGSTATDYEPYKGNTYEVNLGKNLFDKDGLTSAVTIDGTKITMLRSSGWATNKVLLPNIIKAGTILTASRSEYSTTNNADISIQLFKGETSVIYFNLKNASNTLTLTGDVDSYRLTISYNASGDTTGYVKDVQLEIGSTATSYSPYFPPYELDYEDSIKKSTGKNLFDKNAVTRNKIINRDSGTTSTISNYAATDYIPIGENVTFTCTGFNVWYTACYDSNKTYLGYMENSNTMTTLPNTAYIRASILLTNLDLGIGQIELGNQQTSPEPYGKVWYEKSNNQTLKLNSTDYTWYRNTITIDGTTYSQYYTNISDKPFANANVLSNYFKVTSVNQINGFYYGTGGKNLVFMAPMVNGELITTLADWKTWIDSINLEVVGAIDTPIVTEITNTELINQLEAIRNAKSEDGTTNINVTSEDLSMILNVSVIKGDA